MYRWQVIRYIVYGAEIVFAFLLQSTPHALPELFGVKAVVLVPLSLSFAVYERETAAMATGAVCGWLADGSYSGSMSFYGLVLVISGFLVSSGFRYYFRRNRLTVILLSLAAIPLILSLEFLLGYLLKGYPDGGYVFVRHYIPRMVYTLAFTPVCCAVNRRSVRLFVSRESRFV